MTFRYKLYGNHIKGDFYIYIDESLRAKLINELILTNIGNPFSFEDFLIQLNNKIPNKLSLEEKIKKLRDNWNDLRTYGLADMLDESEKTILIGEKRLPEGQKPREKTLRKLYLYTNGAPIDVAALIVLLKKANMTVSWTSPNSRITPASIRNMINKIK